MRRARLLLPGALVGAAVAGAVVAIAVRGGAPAPAATQPPPESTATVVRTSLSTSVLTGGTLGYAPTRPVVNQVAGTYTWLPAAGRRIRPGHALFRVDNQPVVLFRGRTPAWRPFTFGMAGGPDVTELQANLIALGYARGLFAAPDGQFGLLTADAVDRWQAANGYPVTGQISLGQVVFLPAPIRVGPAAVTPGQAAAVGQAPYLATSDRREVTVPDNPDLPTVHPGEQVPVVLPSGITTPGTVTGTGPAPATAGTGTAGTGTAGGGPLITVVPRRPAATGTGSGVAVQVALPTQSVHGVLAVPVSALLALAGGGYGVDVAEPSGAHRLVGVRTGIFAAGRVAISGPGIVAGTKVVIAQ